MFLLTLLLSYKKTQDNDFTHTPALGPSSGVH